MGEQINLVGIFIDKRKRHFRGHKTYVKGRLVVHPCYIIGETATGYIFLGLTHSRKKGKGHPNHCLAENPNRRDLRPAYLRKKIATDRKSNFSESPLAGFSMGKVDEKYVDSLIAKRFRK